MRKILVILMVMGVACLATKYMFSTDAWDQVPTYRGGHEGWGEWFITAFENDTGEYLDIVELGMPCSGPTSGDYGWVVWYDVGELLAPHGDAYTADSYGPYTPADSGSDLLPTTYTNLDLSAEDLQVNKGTCFVIGYDVTGYGGQIFYNGYQTWAWHLSQWDPDRRWFITALIQCLAVTTIPDIDPPYMYGMDPDIDEADVPLDSNIVFHCIDEPTGVDTTTIEFTVKDTSPISGRAASPGAAVGVTLSPTGAIVGDLDIDDSDLTDVVCTFDPTDDLPVDRITCTVDGDLADLRGNEMGVDFIWRFTTEGFPAVKGVSWGQLKAEF